MQQSMNLSLALKYVSSSSGGTPPINDKLLLETGFGDFLLLETGDKILLEYGNY